MLGFIPQPNLHKLFLQIVMIFVSRKEKIKTETEIFVMLPLDK